MVFWFFGLNWKEGAKKGEVGEKENDGGISTKRRKEEKKGRGEKERKRRVWKKVENAAKEGKNEIIISGIIITK